MKALGIDGFISANELSWLAAQAASRQVIVEIGTWKGRSAAAIAEYQQPSGTVFCIDHFAGCPESPETFTEVTTLEGIDAVKRQCADNLGQWISSGKLFLIDRHVEIGVKALAVVLSLRPADMVFIDGAHNYDDFCRDVALARSIIAAGGLLCGHDRGWVRRGLDDYVPGWRTAVESLWFAEG